MLCRYLLILLFSLATGIAFNVHYETGYPVWALFVSGGRSHLVYRANSHQLILLLPPLRTI